MQHFQHGMVVLCLLPLLIKFLILNRELIRESFVNKIINALNTESSSRVETRKSKLGICQFGFWNLTVCQSQICKTQVSGASVIKACHHRLEVEQTEEQCPLRSQFPHPRCPKRSCKANANVDSYAAAPW